MATLTLNLDSAQTLRDNWAAILAMPGKLDELLADGVVAVAMDAHINASVVWREYECTVDISTFYRAFGEKIADKATYTRIRLDQQSTQNLALFVMSQNAAVYQAFLEANDGVPLEILPPYVAPTIEPEPIPEPGEDLPPVDQPADGEAEPGAGA